jgi:ribbon-helix-helix CopG family protein
MSRQEVLVMHTDQDVVMSGNRPDVESAQPSRSSTEPKRINVAISPEMVRALDNVIEREGVTLTEALRRLVGYGDFVYRAIKEGGEQLSVSGPDGTREVVLL